MAYTPMILINASGLPLVIDGLPEAATQTFKQGVPLRLSSGYLAACDTADPWSAADVVVGVSVSFGKNLTAAGTAEEGYSIGSAPNQASSKIIPVGVPVKRAECAFYRASGSNIFEISLKAGQTHSAATVVAGSYYALKYDATTGYWYVDNTDTTGNNCCVSIVGVNPNDNTKVRVVFKSTQRYYS